MATILSFRNYPPPLLLRRCSLIPSPYLRSVSSGDRRRWLHFSVSPARNRKVEAEISDDGRRSSAIEAGKQVGKRSASEEDFEWKWPLWKELPMRYKLIGTTSLAFVVCNMDKDAPLCTWSPTPQELKGTPQKAVVANAGFVTIVIYPRHADVQKLDKTAWSLSTFHAYANYHVKVQILLLRRGILLQPLANLM